MTTFIWLNLVVLAFLLGVCLALRYSIRARAKLIENVRTGCVAEYLKVFEEEAPKLVRTGWIARGEADRLGTKQPPSPPLSLFSNSTKDELL